MKWCSGTFAAVMFAAYVAVWAAAAVLADVLVLAVVAAAAAAVLVVVTVWNDVVEFPAVATASAAVELTSLASVAVAAGFTVEPVRGSADELVHATE